MVPAEFFMQHAKCKVSLNPTRNSNWHEQTAELQRQWVGWDQSCLDTEPTAPEIFRFSCLKKNKNSVDPGEQIKLHQVPGKGASRSGSALTTIQSIRAQLFKASLAKRAR